jgi:hypothetical protein
MSVSKCGSFVQYQLGDIPNDRNRGISVTRLALQRTDNPACKNSSQWASATVLRITFTIQTLTVSPFESKENFSKQKIFF